MPIPDFIVELRKSIGTSPLWLSGVTAVVTRGDDLLMVRRADTGAWTPVTGIIDPGEQPAVAARREVLEEADVVVEVEKLASVTVSPPVVYDNGDQTQYLDLIFLCRWVSGEPRPADGENLEARWFPRDALPPVTAEFEGRISAALAGVPEARFVS